MNPIEDNSISSGVAGPVGRVYTADSSLRHPRAFIAAGLRDLRQCWPTTKRFFSRSLAQRYRYSSLGIFWAFVPAIITALVLIAGQKSRLLTHSLVPPPFYGVFGLTLGQTFLDALNALRTVFTAHQQLLRRNNVPLEGLIASAVVEAGFNSVVRLAVLAAAFAFFGVRPLVTLPLALCGFIGTLLIGGGLGLILAPYSTLKRDIENVMIFLPWVLFATTPIFVAPAPNSLPAMMYRFNPLAWIFDSTRTLAYGEPGHRWPALLSVPVGFAFLLLGWLLCRLWRPYVVERALV
jgi:lipopolysaccharide transport system permease protein